jgi:uncharacterized protein YjbI with pentapeptide repeats
MDTSLKKPTGDNRDDWKAYWQQQGQLWRTEPEISQERQAELDQRRTIPPDIQTGIYPFKDIEPKLTRADIEWLLATHDNDQGPINPNDEAHRNRLGLDLRGMDLSVSEEHPTDLTHLPLAHTRFGLSNDEFQEVRNTAIAKAKANLQSANFFGANLQGTDLHLANLQGASLFGANLQGANLRYANLQDASLSGANLQGADLRDAELQGASLWEANLQGADLRNANLQVANLQYAQFDAQTRLNGIKLSDRHNGRSDLANIKLNGADLTVIDWDQLPRFGGDTRRFWEQDLNEQRDLTRTYRQLATALRGQGMNDDADRYAYRAQLCQRGVLIRRGRIPQYLFSHFLDLIAGYGYRPFRSLIAYLLIIGLFALLYHQLGTGTSALNWQESIVVSMTAFHGRGFLTTSFQAGDPQALASAIEAFVGLIIEVSFIATFTQRFFGK